MCMFCVDEALMVAGIAVATVPWYRSAWAAVCKLFRGGSR